MLLRVNWKDKAATLVLGIFRPRRFLDAELFPWWLAIVAVIAGIGLGFLEPLPEGIGMDFTAGYLALMAVASLIGWLGVAPWAWLLLRLFGAKPALLPLLRLAAGASLVCVWTFPLAFVMRSPGASALLSLLREVWFALIFGWGASSFLSRRRVLWMIVAVIFVPAWSLGMQLLPEASNLSHLHMRDASSGQVAPLAGNLPDGPLPAATWTLYGRPGPALEAARVALGERQQVRFARPGILAVDVRPGASAGDSVAFLVTASPAAVSLVASVPPGTPHERLLALHALVQSRVRYQRKFFPGDVQEILARGSGDCKAYAQVFAEGAAALGFPSRVVRGLLARSDGFWAHAWVSVKVDGRWEEWDPTSPIPSPDARYLRFSPPHQAGSVFEGEMAIFALDSLRIEPR